MKFGNLLKVYKRDWKSILRNPVALIIILGICVLPSLYAWINIAACWDVYENTGTIPVAVVNNDETVSFNENKINIGDDVVEELKKNRNIKWIFVDSKKANLGLMDGTYYAMIEIPKNFSSNFLSVLSERPQKPYIIYKVDTKINPVAVKITDSAKNALVQQIKTNFVSTVNETIFSSLNIIGKDADNNKENLLKLKDAIIDINRNMDVIQASLESVHANSDNLNQFLKDIDAVMPAIQNSLNVVGESNLNKQNMIRSAQTTLNNANSNIDTNLSYAQASNDRINELFKTLNESTSSAMSAKTNAVLPSINLELESLNNAITSTTDYLKIINEADNTTEINNDIEQLKKLQTTINDYKKQLIKMQKDLTDVKGSTGELNKYLNSQTGNIDNGINTVDQTRLATIARLESLNKVLNDKQLTDLINQLNTVSPKDLKEQVNKALEASKKAEADSNAIIDALNAEITKAIKEMDKMNVSIDKIIKFLESVRTSDSGRKERVASIITALENTQTSIANQKTQFANLQQQLNQSNEISKTIASGINNNSYKIKTQLNSAIKQYNTDVKDDLNMIGDNLLVATSDAAEMIESAKDLNTQITNSILLAQEGSSMASDFSGELNGKLLSFKSLVSALGSKFELIDNSDLVLLISILQSNPEFMGDFMSNPFELKTESIYAIPNYGSSMAPIYTTLALWVGCMILNSVLKANVGYFEGVEKLTAKEKHFGKMMIFCTLAMIQGLIVAVGDIALLGIYVVNAPLFVIFSVVSSLVFSIITFTLMSTLGNVGKALSIVYMILQLVGSGGTYPIQVDPLIFRIIQPLCPFTYTVSGLREAVAGPLAISVIKDFVALFIFGVVFLLFGYFLIDRLNPWVRRFERKLKESGIGE